MAELGVAASIAGLLSLTIQVLEVGAIYVDKVRRASKIFDDLLRQLASLKQGLDNLTELAINVQDTATSTLFSRLLLGNEAEKYRKSLESLGDDLRKRTATKRSKLLWPLSEERIRRDIEALQRYHGAIHRALGIDAFAQALETLQESRRQRREREEQKTKAILDWLSPSNMHQKQRDIFSTHHKGTGHWLLGLPVFEDWLTKDDVSPVLLCCGIPGSGKTVMTSIVVDHLMHRFPGEEVGIAFLYCSYSDEKEQTVLYLVASLAKQLATRFPDRVQESKEIAKEHKLDLSQLQTLLGSLTKKYAKIFVVVDALDECAKDERRLLLDCLQALLQVPDGRIRVFVTSRPPVQQIKTFLGPAVDLQIRAHDSDLEAYVSNEISKDDELLDLISSESGLKERIVSLTCQRASGMFLMAVLQTKRIRYAINVKQVERALDSVPGDLPEMYTDTLARIKAQPESRRALAMRVFSWLQCAKRPLNVEELRHALAIETSDDPATLFGYLDQKNLIPTKTLLDVCAGLVILEAESQIITLVHPTTLEWLQQNSPSLFADPDLNISKACLAYLLLDVFEKEGPCASDQELEDRLGHYVFLDYASRCWGHHVRGKGEPQLQTLILTLLRKNRNLSCATQVVNSSRLYPGTGSQTFPKALSGLHTAVYFGLEYTIDTLLKSGVDIMTKGANGSTALHWASSGGHEAAAALLLRLGADIAARDADGETPLHYASLNGHTAVMQLLFDRGAVVNAEDLEHSTPLHAAAAQGQLDAVRLLLDLGADLTLRDLNGRTPLLKAVSHGEEAVVESLLDRGADVNDSRENGSNALCKAIACCHEGIAKILIERGASVTAKNYYGGWTALHYAAHNGLYATIRLLLDHQAEVNATGDLQETPLLQAVRQNHVEVIRLLLSRGVDVNFDCGLFGNALQVASRDGNEVIVGILLARGADVHLQGGKHGTCLIAAAKGGHQRIFQALLEHGADCHQAGGKYGGSLLAAARGGNETIIRTLLEKGVDPNCQIGKYRSNALQAAAKGKHIAVVRLLLERGLDVNAQGGIFANALQAAVVGGSGDLVQLLLDEGADVDAQGGKFGSAVKAAIYHNDSKLLKLLLSRGAALTNSLTEAYKRVPIHIAAWSGTDVLNLLRDTRPDLLDFSIRDKQGRVALHYAASARSDAWIGYILDINPNPNIRDDDGWTPLHWACKRGVRTVVEHLLHRGADPSLVTHDGWTPLRLAIFHNHPHLISLLRPEADDEVSFSEIARAAEKRRHPNILCAGCTQEIYGTRYRCVVCHRFNFCFKCHMSSFRTHPPFHEFKAFESKVESRRYIGSSWEDANQALLP